MDLVVKVIVEELLLEVWEELLMLLRLGGEALEERLMESGFRALEGLRELGKRRSFSFFSFLSSLVFGTRTLIDDALVFLGIGYHHPQDLLLQE